MSDFVHTIRLRDGWRTKMIQSGSPAIVRCERSFGMPTGLDVEQQIDLVIQPANSCVQVLLNGTQIGQQAVVDAVLRFSVRDLIQDRNLLQIDFELPLDQDLHGDLAVGDVCLEIRE